MSSEEYSAWLIAALAPLQALATRALQGESDGFRQAARWFSAAEEKNCYDVARELERAVRLALKDAEDAKRL